MPEEFTKVATFSSGCSENEIASLEAGNVDLCEKSKALLGLVENGKWPIPFDDLEDYINQRDGI